MKDAKNIASQLLEDGEDPKDFAMSTKVYFIIRSPMGFHKNIPAYWAGRRRGVWGGAGWTDDKLQAKRYPTKEKALASFARETSSINIDSLKVEAVYE